MRRYIIFPVLMVVISLLLFSCKSYEEDVYALKKSIFINDVENPGLPIYSEWGYNTFGAYIDRSVFVSDDYNFTKIIVNTDTLNLLLKGTMNGKFASIKFSFVGFPITNYTNLSILDRLTINMKGDKCKVVLTLDKTSKVLNIIEGGFEFRRVQNLYVDKEYTKSIISGVFYFKTFFDNEPVAISNGRFDLGIGYENFYNY